MPLSFYDLNYEDAPIPKCGGGQSCLLTELSGQPSRLKGGCSHDWLPHYRSNQPMQNSSGKNQVALRTSACTTLKMERLFRDNALGVLSCKVNSIGTSPTFTRPRRFLQNRTVNIGLGVIVA